MLGTITQIDMAQLRLLLRRGWVRRIRSVHIHHTWRPDHSQWKGQATVESIRRYHVEDLGWSDIAEHLTIGPDGTLWTGRNLDAPPASIAGHNGSSAEGPFMIEIVGDFDTGRDPFRDPQAASVYQTVAEILAAFEIDSSQIRFHNEFTGAKTCPGTSLRLPALRAAVDARLKAVKPAAIAVNEHARAYAARSSMIAASEGGRALDSGNAEPPYDATQAARAAADAASARGLFTQFKPADIEVFRSHVVDLERGQLSQGGAYQNSEFDLDELINRLDRWVAKRPNKVARVMFFAHGGLVSESAGLDIVLRDYEWWLANDVYPVFFVWETGFLEIFSQQRELQRDRRAFVTDPILEATLGPTVGEPAWTRMKDSAFLSSSPSTGTGKPGGAMLFLSKLAAWYATPNPQAAKVRFHAVGHSAGAIFQSHFVPALETAFNGVANAPNPVMNNVALLAPAVRVDLFKQMLMPRVGNSIGGLTVFTMERRAELVDNVLGIYRKSLLYFVRNACETPTHSTPILGLEESIRADADLVKLFGLGGSAGAAHVIWSPTSTTEGDSASKSEHHGYFDNDWVTMNSVMRRILAIPDSTPLPCPHLPEPDEPASTFPTSPERDLRQRASSHALAAATHAGGRRSAVCIGIDDYGVQSLNGCVADARSWASALTAGGFAVTRLTDRSATRQRIMDAMESVLAKSATGDVVVIQYAGHGTQVPDGNGDESDGLDEAWVPHDFEQGEFVIDDDIGALFDRYRNSGIQLVVFTDCCHSGSSTRLLFRPGAPELERHSRYMRVPPEIVARFSAKREAGQSGARFGGQDSIGWEIHYAACQDRQSAYEHGGHGDFTSAATKAMAKVAGSSMTYQSLADALEQAFTGNPDQTPQLRAPTGIGARPLFGSTRDIADGAASAGAPAAAPASDIGAMIAVTERLSAAVDALSKKIDDL